MVLDRTFPERGDHGKVHSEEVSSYAAHREDHPASAILCSREYLTDTEVAALMKAARNTGRHGHRDATLTLVACRHGLRVSELVSLR
jgi:type 1 fimbriae regulatory protein FimB/type 1 fimbriae regulatory protein FimE